MLGGPGFLDYSSCLIFSYCPFSDGKITFTTLVFKHAFCIGTFLYTNIIWYQWLLQVTFTEQHVSFLHFLTNVCAIVGGNVPCVLFSFMLTSHSLMRLFLCLLTAKGSVFDILNMVFFCFDRVPSKPVLHH